MRHVFAESRDFVLAEQDLRHRLDIRCIELIELFDMGQDLAEVVRHTPHFFIGQPQIGEISDVTDFFIGEIQVNAFLREGSIYLLNTDSEDELGAYLESVLVRRRCVVRALHPLRLTPGNRDPELEVLNAVAAGQFSKAIQYLRAQLVKLALPNRIFNFNDQCMPH